MWTSVSPWLVADLGAPPPPPPPEAEPALGTGAGAGAGVAAAVVALEAGPQLTPRPSTVHQHSCGTCAVLSLKPPKFSPPGPWKVRTLSYHGNECEYTCRP